MKWILCVLALAGCSGTSKHETLSLQCLGFCSMTNINHETTKENQNEETARNPVRNGFLGPRPGASPD